MAGQQHGLVVLDGDDQVVRPAKLWNDTESAPDARWLVEQLGAGDADRARSAKARGRRRADRCRWPRSRSRSCRGCTAPSRSTWSRVARVCLPHDWLTLEADRRVRDRPRRRVGHRLLLRRARRVPARPARDRRRRRRLGAAAPAVLGRRRRPARHARSGSGAVVGPGTGDNMAAALALGLEPGDVAISLGTSGTVYTVSDAPTADPTGAVAGFADATGRFLPLVCTLNATKVTDAVARMARRRPRGARRARTRRRLRRGRRRRRALLRRRAHAEPARRHGHDRGVANDDDARADSRARRSRAWSAACSTASTRSLRHGRPRRRRHRARRRRRAVGRVPTGAGRPVGPAGGRARRGRARRGGRVRAGRRGPARARRSAEVAREWDLARGLDDRARPRRGPRRRCAPRTPTPGADACSGRGRYGRACPPTDPVDGVRRLDPRSRRQHAARPAAPPQRGREPAVHAVGQGRDGQSGRQRQGPRRDRNGRRRRTRRPAAPGRHDRRADLGQHRRRARDRRRAARLPVHLRHERQDERREDRVAALVRRRGGGVPDRGAARGSALVLLDRRAPGARDAGRVSSRSVLERRQPARARADDRPRDLGADRRPRHALRGRGRHRRHDHRRRPRARRRATRRSRSSAPIRRARCTRAAPGARISSRESARTSGPTTFDRTVVDRVVEVTDADSFLTARRVTHEEGLHIGGSGGTAVHAALEIARAARPRRGGRRAAARLGTQLPVEDLRRPVDVRHGFPARRRTWSPATCSPRRARVVCPISCSCSPRRRCATRSP